MPYGLDGMYAPAVSLASKSRYNNWLITKLISIFANVEERWEEREEGLALIKHQAGHGCIAICGPKQKCMWGGVGKRK
jgi:hypothetical protein